MCGCNTCEMSPSDACAPLGCDCFIGGPTVTIRLRWCACFQGTWGSVQDPASPSKVESWSQSSWFKLVVVLIVAAVVTSVVALAWVTVPSLRHKTTCDVAVAGKLLDEIHAATSVKGQNYVERFYHQDLCFSNTTVITVPAGVTVNITAEPLIKLQHFRFVVSPTAALHLANVALTGANWTDSEGGAAAAVHGTPTPTRTPKSDADTTAAKSSSNLANIEVPQRNTSFTCVNCTFEKNVQWTQHTVAKGGAVYVDGKTASFKCVNCTFTDNTARAIGSPTLDGYDSGEDMVREPAVRGLQNATVHGGAIYVGQGNITLISPRFKNNHAICMASALKAGCTAAANDVSLCVGEVWVPLHCSLRPASLALPRDCIAACCYHRRLPTRFIWRAEQSNWDAKSLPTGLTQHAVCTHNAKTIHGVAIMLTRVCLRRVACSATAMCCRTITLTHLHLLLHSRGKLTDIDECGGAEKCNVFHRLYCMSCWRDDPSYVQRQLQQHSTELCAAASACVNSKSTSNIFSPQQHIGSPIVSLNRSAPPLLSPSMFSAMAPRLNARLVLLRSQSGSFVATSMAISSCV